MNTDNVYYLFYDQINQELIKLDLLRLFDLVNDTCFVTFPFVLHGKYAHNSQDLVDLVNEHNWRVYNRYQDEYKIKPPYFIKHAYSTDVNIGVYVFIIYKKVSLLFYKDMRDEFDNYPFIEPFFSKYRDLKFCGYYMKKLHEFIMDNQIVRPDPKPECTCFNAVIKGKIYKARICKENTDHCFLSFPLTGNRYVFDYYNIGEDEVLDVLGINEWQGDWPETTESKVYELINYINECRNSGSNPDKVEISGNEIITSFARLEIKQSKNGKWYISGSFENILKLFHINDQVKLKQMVNNLFGSKRRAGVFPELDSRDDVIKLIKATQHE